jgi:hypothetical protein
MDQLSESETCSETAPDRVPRQPGLVVTGMINRVFRPKRHVKPGASDPRC